MAALFLPSVVSAAPVAVSGMDAGQISANIDQGREWKPKENDADIKVDHAKEKTVASNVKIKLNQIKFSGNTLFPAAKLTALLQKDLQKEVSFDDLQKMSDKITGYYREQGYLTAFAYWPVQDIQGGIVTMNLYEGKFGDVKISNRSALTTQRAQGFLHNFKAGKIIRQQTLDRVLLIVNDIPGVKSHAIVSPGKEGGVADVEFRLSNVESASGAAYADNYGNRYTGRTRLGALYHWNNLTHVGDQLELAYLQGAGANIKNYSFHYSLPVGNDGTTASFDFSRVGYRLGDKYSKYGAYGLSHNLRVSARTPLKRTLNNNLYGELSYEKGKFMDRIQTYAQDTEKSADVVRAGLDGDYREGRFASTYRLTHSMGSLSMDSPLANQSDAYGTSGFFQKTNLNAYYIQRMDNRWMLRASFAAQYPWTNLDSSEKMYIGGYNAVRAYPQGETGGDKGVLASVETRYQTGNKHVQLANFFDFGWVQFYKNPLPMDVRNSRTLSGIGMGILWNSTGQFFARLDYAYPLTNPYSENNGSNMSGTWWFQMVKRL